MCQNGSQDMARETIGRILRLSRKHRQQLDQHLEKIGIGVGEAPILMQLSFHGEMNQRELAQHIGVTAATVSQSLKAMVKKGWVDRLSDEADARVFRLRLTPEGMRMRQEAENVFARVDREILEILEPDTQNQLLEILKKLDTYMRGENL